MGDIIYPDFSKENPIENYKVVPEEELIDYRPKLKTLLIIKQKELSGLEDDRLKLLDLGKIDRLKNEIERINEWLINLDTQPKKNIKAFIDQIENPNK